MSGANNPSAFGPNEIITLSKQGVWLSNGEEITHDQTCLAFARNLYHTLDGFEIRIGPEKKAVQIEDTLYFVQSIDGAPPQGFNLTLNDGRKIKLDAATLEYRPGRLTCKVDHPNEKTKEDAKFLSAAYYELLNHVDKTETGFVLKTENKSFILSTDQT